MKLFKLKSITILLLLLFLFIIISAFSYTNAISNNIANSVFRLHVLANSDDSIDQDLKYKVRDELLKYMNSLIENINSKEDAINIVESNKQNFIDIAKNTIIQNGFDYDVTIEIGNFSFPTKTYGNISLPSGYYDAIRVKIGEAKGQNWWCVMFPPLCFVDTSSAIVDDSSKEILKDSLSDEEFALINSSDSSDITFKFKLIEMFENMKILLAQN
ncbi:MAG: stage II sporulation protein R [Clostridia bacterium]|nr:stage II sporulation protein R [Clostridia bacterium]